MMKLEAENRALAAEVNYYRSLLFSNIDPTNASILNALRHAVDAVEENEALRSGGAVKKLETLCLELEKENACLRRRLKNEV